MFGRYVASDHTELRKRLGVKTSRQWWVHQTNGKVKSSYHIHCYLCCYY